MLTSLSEGLSLLSFLHISPTLPQELWCPPVHWASGPLGVTPGVTWAARMNATTAASPITHSSCRAPAPQAASMGHRPGHRHLCPPPNVGRAWLRHGAHRQIRGCSTMHTIPGGVLCLPNTALRDGSRLSHFVCLLVCVYGYRGTFFFFCGNQEKRLKE